MYEKTSEFARFGGPIQFASNALSVLKEIDDNLFDRVMEKFTFTGIRTCGIKDGLRSDGSFRMTDDSLDYLVNPDAPADWFVKFPLKECADLFGLRKYNIMAQRLTHSQLFYIGILPDSFLYLLFVWNSSLCILYSLYRSD